MKGLSLTLTVVIVAIVLLVTALVVMTIFGGQIAQFIGILNPWSENMLKQSLCNQKCAAYCQGHIGEGSVPWSTIGSIDAQSDPKACSTIMGEISDECACRGIPVAGETCKLKCGAGDTAGQVKTGQGSCPSGKTCTVTCPTPIPLGGQDMTGTCK